MLKIPFSWAAAAVTAASDHPQTPVKAGPKKSSKRSLISEIEQTSKKSKTSVEVKATKSAETKAKPVKTKVVPTKKINKKLERPKNQNAITSFFKSK